MNQKFNITLVLLRLSLGWYMFFAGLEKLLTPGWSSLNFLLSSRTFVEFYSWFARPENIWWVDQLNTWGMLLIGIALLLGVFTRAAAISGAILMMLYYFPQNSLPIVSHGYIVEEHVIYAIAFVLVAYAPKHFSLALHLQNTFINKIPYLNKFI